MYLHTKTQGMNEEASTRAAVANERLADARAETGDKPPSRTLERRANIHFCFPEVRSHDEIAKVAGML